MFDLPTSPHPAPEAPQAPSVYALVLVASLLASAVLTGPRLDGGSAAATVAHRAGVLPDAIDCRVEPAPVGDTRLAMTNTTGATLSAGTRLGWASAGTPDPVGGVLVLPHDLQVGESLTLHADTSLRGLGCQARVLADEAEALVARWQ